MYSKPVSKANKRLLFNFAKISMESENIKEIK